MHRGILPRRSSFCHVPLAATTLVLLSYVNWAVSVPAATIDEVCARYRSEWITTYAPASDADQYFNPDQIVAVSPGVDYNPQRCVAGVNGTRRAPFVQDALKRLNYYRWLAGELPVPLDEAWQRRSESCGLMMAMNYNAESPYYRASSDPHTIHTGWVCTGNGGSSTAPVSNIYAGQSIQDSWFEWQTTPAHILRGMVDDYGSDKQGHRQNLLCPNLGSTTFGHVCYNEPTTRRYYCGSCSYVYSRTPAAMPATGFVAWPPPNVSVPVALVPQNPWFWWSFAAYGIGSSPVVTVNGKAATGVRAVLALCRGDDGVVGHVGTGEILTWLRFQPPDAYVTGQVLQVVVTDERAHRWAYTVRTVDCAAVVTPPPTRQPTLWPTPQPTRSPTLRPTLSPTARPSAQPTAWPTPPPSLRPTPSPTLLPTLRPSTPLPTVEPTVVPTLPVSPKPASDFTTAPPTTATARFTDTPTTTTTTTATATTALSSRTYTAAATTTADTTGPPVEGNTNRGLAVAALIVALVTLLALATWFVWRKCRESQAHDADVAGRLGQLIQQLEEQPTPGSPDRIRGDRSRAPHEAASVTPAALVAALRLLQNSLVVPAEDAGPASRVTTLPPTGRLPPLPPAREHRPAFRKGRAEREKRLLRREHSQRRRSWAMEDDTSETRSSSSDTDTSTTEVLDSYLEKPPSREAPCPPRSAPFPSDDGPLITVAPMPFRPRPEPTLREWVRDRDRHVRVQLYIRNLAARSRAAASVAAADNARPPPPNDFELMLLRHCKHPKDDTSDDASSP